MTQRRDFAAFYAATFAQLCAQLYVHTGSLAEPQDVVQEAFSRALPRWEKVSEYDDPTARVRKVAWNLATSRWRRVRRLTALTHPAARHPHACADPGPGGVAGGAGEPARPAPPGGRPALPRRSLDCRDRGHHGSRRGNGEVVAAPGAWRAGPATRRRSRRGGRCDRCLTSTTTPFASRSVISPSRPRWLSDRRVWTRSRASPDGVRALRPQGWLASPSSS